MKKIFVPVIFANGMQGTVNINTIPNSAWKKYSGTAPDGTPVNSMEATQCGHSTIVKKGDRYESYKTSDLQVFAAGLVQEAGGKVEFPQGHAIKLAA